MPAASDGLEGWAGHAQWRILDTDFSRAENFLATWHAWLTDSDRPLLLHVVACCAQPPTSGELSRGLDAAPASRQRLESLRGQWWGLLPGVHRLVFEHGRVLLTLLVGPAQRLLAAQEFSADSVLLHGAASGIDPLDLVKLLARRSRVGTTLIARACGQELGTHLTQAGFVLDSRASGPASPLRAVFRPHWTPRRPPAPVRVPERAVIIGSGLAGAAAAASLARRGWQVDVLDAAEQPAAGASGLPAGLLAPHTSPDDNQLSRLTRSGVRMTLQQASMLLREGQDWEPSGVRQERGEGARALPDLGPGQEAWQRLVGAGSTAVWHAAGGWIQPAALVRAWLAEPGVRWRGSSRVRRLVCEDQQWQALDADGAVLAKARLMIVAAAHASAGLAPAALPLHPVRGQVSWGLAAADVVLSPSPVNGNGHFLPRVPTPAGDIWLTGSTYVRADASSEPRTHDDAANLARLRLLLPQVADTLAPAFERGQVNGWAGVRCVTSDRRPVVGELAPGLWISAAMGSRGLTFAALCGELLVARLHGEPLPLEPRLAQALDARRLRES